MLATSARLLKSPSLSSTSRSVPGDGQAGRPHEGHPRPQVLDRHVLLPRDAPRRVLGRKPHPQREHGASPRHRSLARRQEAFGGQAPGAARRMPADKEDAHPQGIRPRLRVADERIGPVEGVVDVVLAEALGEWQGELQDLPEVHRVGHEQGHAAERGILARRHLLPVRPVRVTALYADRELQRDPPLPSSLGLGLSLQASASRLLVGAWAVDPDRDLRRHTSLPAPLRSSCDLGHRMAGKLAQIG